jgi:hypothetical protein
MVSFIAPVQSQAWRWIIFSMQNATDDKEILEYITTIAGTYGMQVKQPTLDYVITNGNAGLVVDVQYH